MMRRAPLKSPCTRRKSLSCRAALSAALFLWPLGAIAAASPAVRQPPPLFAKAAAPASADTLDSMTRDGSAASEPDNSKQSPGAAGTQSMNVGGAVARTLLSLALVLACVVGAIKYLKRKGYGVGGDPSAASLPPAQKGFGVSPVAQALLAASAKPNARNRQIFQSRTETPIDDFQVLGTQPLPGSNHTLYKVQVGDRVLLLGGSASGPLSVLTEWDVEPQPRSSAHGFDAVLDRYQDQNLPPVTSDRLQDAAGRLTAAIRRAGAIDPLNTREWSDDDQ